MIPRNIIVSVVSLEYSQLKIHINHRLGQGIRAKLINISVQLADFFV
jgi:hypothetical protein